MTFQEAVKSGKLIRRTGGNFGPAYGRVVDVNDKVEFFYGEGSHMPLSLLDIIADDWQSKPEPRTFWLGMTKIQSHSKEVLVLSAIVSAEKPTSRTANGEEWFKVLEVLPTE